MQTWLSFVLATRYPFKSVNFEGACQISKYWAPKDFPINTRAFIMSINGMLLAWLHFMHVTRYLFMSVNLEGASQTFEYGPPKDLVNNTWTFMRSINGTAL